MFLIYKFAFPNGSVAQLVEHDTLNVGVVGSIPTGTTKTGFAIESGFSFMYFKCSNRTIF